MKCVVCGLLRERERHLGLALPSCSAYELIDSATNPPGTSCFQPFHPSGGAVALLNQFSPAEIHLLLNCAWLLAASSYSNSTPQLVQIKKSAAGAGNWFYAQMDR
jgi:hypothetical protein